MHVRYDRVWENFLDDNYFPTYLRDIREIEFSDLKSCVLNNKSVTSKMILDLLQGDLFIVKNVLSVEQANQVKTNVHEYGQSVPTEDFVEDSCIPNFHCKTHGGQVKDGYDEVGHAYFFYRWNEDILGVFSAINHYWEIIKILNGLGPNGIKENLPKDGIIDRIQLLHYPINTGEITPHCDVSRWQKTNIGINLTERGKHFDSGGFYCLNKKQERVDIEPMVRIGDAICWVPTVFHGVEKPTSSSEIDWSKSEGRWQLLAFTVQSKIMNNRIVSISHDNFKKNPKKVLEEYLFDDESYKEYFNYRKSWSHRI